MRLAIIGSRSFSDYKLFKEIVYEYFCYDDGFIKFTEIISGGAKGVDSLATELASEWGIKLTEFLPDYNKYGKGAPLIRNELIIKEATHVLALWDSVSRGTANSLSIAKRLKKPTLIIYF